jgi:hypothetical protein
VQSYTAASPAPFQQQDGMTTQVRHACGAGMHMVNGVCVTTAARRQVRRCAVWMQGTFAESGIETPPN